ncbi:MAG: copper chaperone PCu(A)C [Proteobacteria bacterium]|nr:copper chaperone PCu(A)C [Pseudomonadota bacterium]
MKTITKLICSACLLVAIPVAWAATPSGHAMGKSAMPMPAAQASGAHVLATVRVDGAWVRAAPPGTDMLAGYMVIHNMGKTPLRLESAESEAFGMAELHRTTIKNGVSTMQPAGAQVIVAGGELRIAPGGLHWMLMAPKRALKIGDAVGFSLHFAGGGVANVRAVVATQAPGG